MELVEETPTRMTLLWQETPISLQLTTRTETITVTNTETNTVMKTVTKTVTKAQPSILLQSKTMECGPRTISKLPQVTSKSTLTSKLLKKLASPICSRTPTHPSPGKSHITTTVSYTQFGSRCSQRTSLDSSTEIWEPNNRESSNEALKFKHEQRLQT